VFQSGTMMSAGLVLPRPLFSGLRGLEPARGWQSCAGPHSLEGRVSLAPSRGSECCQTPPGSGRVWQALPGSPASDCRSDGPRPLPPSAEKTALGIGLRLQGVDLRNPSYHLADAFPTAGRGRAEALLLLMSPVLFPQRAQVAELGLKSQLPTICGLSQYAHAGALMSYGANLDEMFRRVAVSVDKILKGAKPADLPVEQPTKFDLVINLKTAKALGLTIPPSLLARADQVIE